MHHPKKQHMSQDRYNEDEYYGLDENPQSLPGVRGVQGPVISATLSIQPPNNFEIAGKVFHFFVDIL